MWNTIKHWLQTRGTAMWKATKKWLYEKRDLFLWAAIFAVVWYFAVRSTASRVFVTSIANAFAWPVILLILLGYRYRRPLGELIDRVQQFEGIGLTLKAGGKAYEKDQAKELVERIESSETDPETKQRLRTLLSLSVQSLRLLGTLAAVGTRQRLNLTLYTKRQRKSAAAFREAIEQLLDNSLITRRGRYYRPTGEGIAVFRLHLDSVVKEID